MAEERKKEEKTRELCFCEKGILPGRDPHTEFRCPQCGRIVWPDAVNGEKR